MKRVAKLPEERSNLSPGSPLVELVQLVVGGLVALSLLVWLGGLAADAAAGWISPERERSLFGAVTGGVTIERQEDRERLERVMAGDPSPRKRTNRRSEGADRGALKDRPQRHPLNNHRRSQKDATT